MCLTFTVPKNFVCRWCQIRQHLASVHSQRINSKPAAAAVPHPVGVSRPAGRGRWVVLALLAALVLVAAFLVDVRVDAWVRTQNNSPWKPLAWFVTHYADWPYLMLCASIFWGLGRRRKRPDWQKLALTMALSCTLSGGSATLVRSVTGRTRPNSPVTQGWYGLRQGGHWVFGQSQFQSFPSGHVGAAVGFVMPLVLWTRRARWLGIAFGLLMVWSRVFTGYHHPSDTMASLCLGIVIGSLVCRRLSSPWAGGPGPGGGIAPGLGGQSISGRPA